MKFGANCWILLLLRSVNVGSACHGVYAIVRHVPANTADQQASNCRHYVGTTVFNLSHLNRPSTYWQPYEIVTATLPTRIQRAGRNVNVSMTFLIDPLRRSTQSEKGARLANEAASSP